MLQKTVVLAESLRHCPTPLLVIELETLTIVEANRCFGECLDYECGALVGKPLTDLFFLGSEDLLRLLVSGVRFDEVSVDLQRADHLLQQFRMSGSRFVSEGVSYWVIALSNMGPVHRQEEVCQNNGDIGRLLDGGSVMLAIADRETGRIVKCNRAFHTIPGYQRENVIGALLRELPLWDSVPAFHEAMERLKTVKRVTGLEIRFWSNERTPIVGECTLESYKHGSADRVLVSIEDLMPIGGPDQEPSLAENSLESLFKDADAPMFLKDRQGRFLQCNDAFAKVLGMHNAAQVRGKLQSDFLSPEEFQRVQSSDQSLFAGGSAHRYEQVWAINGTSKYFAVTKKLWRAQTGEFAGILGIAYDITATKESKRYLTRQNAMKDRLITILAHDLLGPMGSYSSLLKDMRHKVLGQQGSDDAFDVLIESSEDISDLLVNVLTWVQGRTSGELPTFDTRSLVEILSTVIRWARVQAAQKGIVIDITGDRDLVLKTDQQILQATVRNLLSNAIKFSPSGGKVLVRFGEREGGVFIEIEDRGSGMTDERRKRLFGGHRAESAFGTAGETGHGLGLMLTADLVADLGATIEVESEIGQGSLFRIRFSPVQAMSGGR